MEQWHFNAVSILYFTATGISLLLAYSSLVLRPVRGATLFSIMMLSVCLWVTSYVLGIYNSNYNTKLIFLGLEYLGMAGAVYLWVFFVAEYTQLDQWVGKWMYFVLAIVPVFTIINVFRAPVDNIMRQEYIVETVKGIYEFKQNYSWGFYLWTAYAYSMMITGVVMITMRISQVSGSSKRQLFILLPIVFIVLLPNAMYITQNNFIAPYDPTPISMVLTGIFFLLGMYFYKFLDVVPIAHRLILKNVKSGVIIIDSRAHIIECNRVAEEIINKPEKQLLGKHIYKVIPECYDIVKTNPGLNEIKAEKVLGEKKRTFELSVNPLHDNSGRTFGQVIMMWDISVQKQAMEELDAYARTVAHDLKSPLGHILGFAKLVVDQNCSEEERNAYLQHIITSGDKMRNIVDGLLTLAKIRNEDKIDLAPIDLEHIIDNVYVRLKDKIETSETKFVFPSKWQKCIGNDIWIEEVWINLITNAIKYGGSPPKVEVGSYLSGGKVRCWVRDNGIGLTADEMENIFVEFSRFHPNRDIIKGHGLGLSIVKRVMKKLNGDIGVSSVLGVGSTFYFELPALEQ